MACVSNTEQQCHYLRIGNSDKQGFLGPFVSTCLDYSSMTLHEDVLMTFYDRWLIDCLLSSVLQQGEATLVRLMCRHSALHAR